MPRRCGHSEAVPVGPDLGRAELTQRVQLSRPCRGKPGRARSRELRIQKQSFSPKIGVNSHLTFFSTRLKVWPDWVYPGLDRDAEGSNPARPRLSAFWTLSVSHGSVLCQRDHTGDGAATPSLRPSQAVRGLAFVVFSGTVDSFSPENVICSYLDLSVQVLRRIAVSRRAAPPER